MGRRAESAARQRVGIASFGQMGIAAESEARWRGGDHTTHNATFETTGHAATHLMTAVRADSGILLPKLRMLAKPLISSGPSVSRAGPHCNTPGFLSMTSRAAIEDGHARSTRQRKGRGISATRPPDSRHPVGRMPRLPHLAIWRATGEPRTGTCHWRFSSLRTWCAHACDMGGRGSAAPSSLPIIPNSTSRLESIVLQKLSAERTMRSRVIDSSRGGMRQRYPAARRHLCMRRAHSTQRGRDALPPTHRRQIVALTGRVDDLRILEDGLPRKLLGAVACKHCRHEWANE